MNWIIKNSDKLEYHTHLGILLEPIKEAITALKWLIADVDMNTAELEKLPIDHEREWFLISSDEMKNICKSDTQFIWGVFSGIDQKTDFNPNSFEIPYADGNEEVWKTGNLQIENSKIEIVAWDSTYTIVKFTDKDLSVQFKNYFPEAIELENFE